MARVVCHWRCLCETGKSAIGEEECEKKLYRTWVVALKDLISYLSRGYTAYLKASYVIIQI
jgi:hypothetical protein